MLNFKYHKPKTIEEAVAAFNSSEDSRYLLGGHTLLPSMKQGLVAPSDIIDLKRVEGLSDIKINGSNVSIGASATHAEVAQNKALADLCPGITKLAGDIADPMVRHMGTIGGSIANNDPVADYPAGILGLKAKIVTSNRTVTADDFFTGLFETSLEDGEIVKSINFDAPKNSAYVKFKQDASHFAIVGVFVARWQDSSVRVAITGAGENGVYRDQGLEETLSQFWKHDAALNKSISSEGLITDIHADAGYRAHLIRVLTSRAVEAAGG